jgi:hypothetical protein
MQALFRGKTGYSHKLDESLRKYFPEHASTLGEELKHDGTEIKSDFYQKIRPVAEIGFRISTAFENYLREGVMLDAAKMHSKTFKSVWDQANKFPSEERFQRAFDAAAKIDKDFSAKVSDTIDNTMGNYHSYSRHEDLVRLAIPFYGWFRHITRSTMNLVQERPVVANALANLGLIGSAKFDEMASELTNGGELPRFMRGYLPIGDKFLNTKNLNPWATVGELTDFSKLVSGKAGEANVAATSLSPFIGGTIEAFTGKSLLTGAPGNSTGLGFMGDFVANTAKRFPAVQLAGAVNESLAGEQQPGLKDLFNRDMTMKDPNSKMQTTNPYLSLLGSPLVSVNPDAAAKVAKLQGDPGPYFTKREVTSPIDKIKKKIERKKKEQEQLSLLKELLGNV